MYFNIRARRTYVQYVIVNIVTYFHSVHVCNRMKKSDKIEIDSEILL